MWTAGLTLARRSNLSCTGRKLAGFAAITCTGKVGHEAVSERAICTGTPEGSRNSAGGTSSIALHVQQENWRRGQTASCTSGKDIAVRGVSSTAAGHQASAAQLLEVSESSSYDEKRHARCGALSHKALLVDAAGTLLIPTQPAAKVYRELGLRYGVTYNEDEILARYRWAYSQPWYHSRLRYVNDGRPFWKFVVSEATGCSNEEYFNELYDYYSTADAWQLLDPESEKVFASLRDAGLKLAVVSNFDTRLRPIMRQLNCDHWFDVLAVSAEVDFEKPNPTIFLHACEQLGIEPRDAVHVGDDRRNDVWGARDAGCDAWLWGYDVRTFREVAERIGVDVDAPRA